MKAAFRGVATGVFVLVAALAQAQSADPTGHWEGTVTATLGSLEFEVDVTRNAGGELVATYGQPAQGLRGLPLSKVSIDGRTLTFVLLDGGPGGAIFKADVLSDGETLMGDAQSPMGSAPFIAKRTGAAHVDAPVKNAPVSASLEGTWKGTLDSNGRQVELILTIENRADGTASALIAQADRPGLRLPATIAQSGAQVTLGVKTTSASWEGVLNAAGSELAGRWIQSGGSLPLTFHR